MITVPSGTRLIILDLDNTLAVLPIDWNGMKGALGEAFPDVSFRYLNDGLRQVSNRYGREGRSRCFDLIRSFEKDCLSGLRPVPEMLELLRSHRERKLFAICSNNMRATVVDVVHALGVSPVFSLLIGRDDVTEAKPAPEGLLRILSELQMAPAQALCIGNQGTDEEAGAAAGIPTVAVGLDAANRHVTAPGRGRCS